jgi:hypothetical protein
VAEHLAGGATAQQVGVVDAVPARDHGVDQGQQLAARVAGSSRPALATAWVLSNAMSS